MRISLYTGVMICSTMQKPFAFSLAILAIASLFAMLAIGPALAKDIATIPLDKRLQLTSSSNMDVHLLQVTISDMPYGGAYAEHPEDMLWPVLVYTYENHGSVPQEGHLHVIFTDNKGDTYEKTDPGMLNPVQPGNVSSSRLIEIALPKDRTLTKMTVIQGFEQTDYDLAYPPGSPSASPAASSSPSGSSAPGKFCLGSLVLPLMLVCAAWAGKQIVKK